MLRILTNIVHCMDYKGLIRQKPVTISLAVLTAILNYLSFPPFNYSFLSWISFIPFFAMITGIDSWKRAFAYSYFVGFVCYVLLGSWLFQVTVPGAIVLALYFSTFTGLFGAAFWFVKERSMEMLMVPFIWVVLEFLRCKIFTGFPWGQLGYTQYMNIELIQVSDITGVYGISFILMAFNVAVFSYFTRSKQRFTYMAFSLFLISASLMYSKNKMDNPEKWGTASIGIVQGNIPQDRKGDPEQAEHILGEYTGLTRQILSEKPDIIIWPETSYPYLINKNSGLEEVMAIARDNKVPILVGGVYARGDDYCNSAILISEKGEMSGMYVKTHLVPFGEYIPFEKYFRKFRDLVDKPIGDFVSGDEYTLFPLNVTFSFMASENEIRRVSKFFKFGVLICYEDCFGYITREFVDKGANFMVNMTNDAWFGDSAEPEQHLQASVFRAVENRVPVVRAANTGVSCFVDPYGNISARVNDKGKDVFVKGALVHKITIIGSRSFYGKYGDVFVYFCAGMMILVFLVEMLSGKVFSVKH